LNKNKGYPFGVKFSSSKKNRKSESRSSGYGIHGGEEVTLNEKRTETLENIDEGDLFRGFC